MSANIDRVLREKYREAARARAAAGLPPRPSGRRPKFTPEEARKLAEARAAGRSINSLAREHRTSQSVIARYVREGFQPARWTA
jgi:hypothetical protein